jgi:exosortase
MDTTASASGPAPATEAAPRSLAWVPLVVLVMLAAAHLPLLLAQVTQLWIRPHYQFFPLIVVSAVVLAAIRARDLGQLIPGSPRWSYVLVGCAALVLAAGVVLESSLLGGLALLLNLAALLYGIGGHRLLFSLLPAWALLWLAVPLPLELDRKLILTLQSLTTQWSSQLLDLLGVFHVMAGNVVEVSGRRLLVEEACSGVNSFFVVLACTLFYAFWQRRPAVHTLLLLAAALTWVLAANVVRVTGVTYVTLRWNFDMTIGWRHEVFGFLLFALALLLVWSTDGLLLFLLGPGVNSVRPRVSGPAPGAPATRLPPLRRTWLASPAVAVVYALLLAAQWPSFGLGGTGTLPADPSAGPALDTLSAEILPRRWERWERLGFTTETRNPGSNFGEVSKVWAYHLGQNAAAFSLDYPFPNWHDLTRCYTAQGWLIEDQQVLAPQAGEDGGLGFVEVKMTKPAYRAGYLLFAQLNRRGTELEPRRGGANLALYRHATTLQRWQQRIRGEKVVAEEAEAPVYQVQFFVETFTPLDEAEQEQARAFFKQGLGAARKLWPAE